MKTLLILAIDGLMDSSLTITLDVLSTAQNFHQRGEPFQVIVAGYRKTVRTGVGLTLSCNLTFSEVLSSALRPDWIIVPGSGMKTEREIQAGLKKKECLAMMQLLAAMAKLKTRISASCASVFFLADTGLLDGRTATTTWWLSPLFRKMYPAIQLNETKMLVRDGQFLTAGAAFSQLDVALEIVSDVAGASVAYLCSRYLLIEQRSSQARFMIPTHQQYGDPVVVAAEKWIDSHIAETISVQGLADKLAVSTKTLSRRLVAATGDSPIKFIQQRKLMRAVHLIETSTLPLEAIAEKVGYQHSTTLRSLIKRELGISPGKLRSN